MNIATVAHNTIWKDTAANLKASEGHVAHVMKHRPATDIILFPEIGLTGIVEDASNKDFALSAEDIASQLSPIAQKYQVALICGFIETNGSDKPFNSIVAIDKNGSLLGSYSKNHLFTQSQEPAFYTPGNRLTVFDFNGWKCGLSICADLRFPRLYETYKAAGVECVFIANNWVAGRNKAKILEHLVKVRAHENQCFVAAVDRSGSDPTTNYHGISVISNPYAEDIAERAGIYSYARLDKREIASLAKLLPLADSFRPEYKIRN